MIAIKPLTTEAAIELKRTLDVRYEFFHWKNVAKEGQWFSDGNIWFVLVLISSKAFYSEYQRNFG